MDGDDRFATNARDANAGAAFGAYLQQATCSSGTFRLGTSALRTWEGHEYVLKERGC